MNKKTILTTNWFNHNWLFNDNCNLSAETLFLFVAPVEEHQTDREKNQHAHIQLLLCAMECWLSTLDTLFRSENKNEAKNLRNVFINHQLMKGRQRKKTLLELLRCCDFMSIAIKIQSNWNGIDGKRFNKRKLCIFHDTYLSKQK